MMVNFGRAAKVVVQGCWPGFCIAIGSHADFQPEV
jgi:hypothetical protein